MEELLEEEIFVEWEENGCYSQVKEEVSFEEWHRSLFWLDEEGLQQKGEKIFLEAGGLSFCFL